MTSAPLAADGPVDPPAPVTVAVDVGGTAIKCGLVDAAGHLVHEERHPTGARCGPDAVVATIVSVAADLAGAARGFGGAAAVGLGVPGIVDGAAGVARYAANIGWRDVPFAALVADATGLRAVLGHDVRNGALAEARRGAGAGRRSVYFLAIGTGVAGGLVVDGQIEDGATGQAGEIGHLTVRRGGPRCRCGGRGCLEAIASASRIAARYRRAARGRGTARDVARLVDADDPVATAVWTEAIAALADALAAQVVLADPGCIVLGGGLSLAGETLRAPLAAALAERIAFRTPPPLLLAGLGDRAGLIGAALRAQDVCAAGGARGAKEKQP